MARQRAGKELLPLTRSARLIGSPARLAGQDDVFPGQWREMLEQLVWHDRPVGSACFRWAFEVDGIPEHDRGDDEIQATGAEPLAIHARGARPIGRG